MNIPTLQRLRHAVEALAAFAAWGMFAALPVDAASALGGWLARKVGPYLKPSVVARANLRLAFPHLADDQVERLVSEVWDNLGRTVGEFPHLKTIVTERLEIVGGEHIVALGEDGLPGILIGAHFGGWELSGPLADRLGVPVHVVYRAPNNPWIERLLRRARGESAARLIPKGAQGARALISALRKGEHLGVLVDQKMNDGIAVPFFGRDAMTAPAVAHLALKFRCPIVPGRIERLKGAHFRAVVEPPLALPDSGDLHHDTAQLMGAINSLVEGWIRNAPGQWLWLHQRWPK